MQPGWPPTPWLVSAVPVGFTMLHDIVRAGRPPQRLFLLVSGVAISSSARHWRWAGPRAPAKGNVNIHKGCERSWSMRASKQGGRGNEWMDAHRRALRPRTSADPFWGVGHRPSARPSAYPYVQKAPQALMSVSCNKRVKRGHGSATQHRWSRSRHGLAIA